MKYKEIFFIVDLSVNAVRYANEIRGIIKDAVRTVDDITYNKWNIYVNVLTFDGSVFSGKRNIRSRSVTVKYYEPPELRADGRLIHQSNAEGAFRAAFDMGISQYEEWLLEGLDATPPQIIYISDGSFRYTADKEDENLLRPDFIEEMQNFLKNSGIALRVFALNTRNLEADEEKLCVITGNEDHIIKTYPLGSIEREFFNDIFY